MTMIRASLVPALAAGLLCVLVSSIVAGGKGLIGALLGVVVVALFVVSTGLALGPGAKQGPGRAATYFLFFILGNCLAFGAVLAVLLDVDGFAERLDTTALGLTILAASLAWTAAMLRAAGRSRQPVYDLSSED